MHFFSRPRRWASAAAALGTVVAAVALGGGQAAALTPDRYGFAYLDTDNPVGAYVPPLARQWNSAGPPISVTQPGPVGQYRVRIPGAAAAAGVAHVTAVNRTGQWCQVEDYLPSGADEVVDVRCFLPGGVPSRSRFAVLFSTSSGVLPAATAYASLRVTPGGGIVATYNSVGAPNTVTYLGGGDYRVFLSAVGGAPALNGMVQVTARGTVPARCKVSAWTTTPNGQDLRIRCFDSGIVPTPSAWTLSYQSKRAITGALAPPNRFAHVFDTLGAPAVPYNSLGGAVAVGAGGLGLRTVDFSAVGTQPDHMQVTAYGAGPQYCGMAQPWTTSGGAVSLRYVICFSGAAGAPLTTQPSLVTYTSRF